MAVARFEMSRQRAGHGGGPGAGRTPGRHRMAALLAVLAVVAGMQLALAPAASAQGYVPISGSGSTGSATALDQWRRDVNTLFGMTINYAPNGSTAGRNDFRLGQVDFAVSELEYGLSDGGVTEPLPDRAFGYLPIVASGTAFMYNLRIGNTRVTSLRLSGDVLARIFTRQITTWSDPAIQADNPGLALPDRTIVPVVPSTAAGTTAQFTRWLAARHGGIWDAYCDQAGRMVKPCGATSFYPLVPGVEAKPGSHGVAGFVAQDTSDGAITYVEYSYARNAGFPVAKVLNEAGYYVAPTTSNVAVALLKAGIRPDLTQDLSGVYTDGDRRSYPLSSYSYLIVPKDTNSGFSTEKGRTLSDFAYYFLCEGQQQAAALGYSPLPINLVQAGVDQVAQIPGSTNKLNRDDLSRCDNPTFSPDGTNRLVNEAPQPPECDRKGGPTNCTTPSEAKATAITLRVVPKRGIEGVPVVLLATVAPRGASGTVRFTDGPTTLGAPVPVIGGLALLSTPLPRGTHSLTAMLTPTDPAALTPSTSSPVSLTVSPLLFRWQ